ncbi:MAG: DNA polymerase beta domain-containing protein [Parcubacteria group bacterium Greene0416_79]|nr:MAG: DNA polymerase beta domain-containing protein [Parcubacteria group bacterium Greene0416_79]
MHMSIADIQQKLSPVFRAFDIKRASVFGSVARGDERAGSDVDILIVLGKPMGLISYSRLVNEIEARLGRPADVVTEKGLNKFVRPHALRATKTIYEG